MMQIPKVVRKSNSLLEQLSIPSSSKSLAWRFGAVFGINLLCFLILYLLCPDQRHLILKEDSLVENLTALLYFVAFFFGYFLIWRSRKFSKSLVFFSFLGLLAFLDELSFGERLFHLSMPRLRGFKIDAAHDFVDMFYEYGVKAFLYYPAFSALLVGSLTALTIYGCIKYALPVLKLFSVQTITLGAIFIGLGSAALIIDLDLIHAEILFALEEIFEMNAAVCLLFLCASLKSSEKRAL